VGEKVTNLHLLILCRKKKPNLARKEKKEGAEALCWWQGKINSSGPTSVKGLRLAQGKRGRGASYKVGKKKRLGSGTSLGSVIIFLRIKVWLAMIFSEKREHTFRIIEEAH